jgi:hypothetical protein
MKYIKLVNKRSGKFCTGSMSFEFNDEGMVFKSKLQVDRYIKLISKCNEELINSCINDMEVVEYELTPTKVQALQSPTNH